jgi:hypothetical protein
MVYSQIWLNLPRDDCNLSCIKKFLNKILVMICTEARHLLGHTSITLNVDHFIE